MSWQMKSSENTSWLIITTEMLALLLLSLMYCHHHLRNKLSLPMYREQRLEEVPNVNKCPAETCAWST